MDSSQQRSLRQGPSLLYMWSKEPLSLDVDTRGAEEEESKRRRAMPDLSFYQTRRAELKARYLSGSESAAQPTSTGGVDHLVLICSDLDATIHFYTQVLGMRLTRIVQNRDEPTSTHIFLDMGGVINWHFSIFLKRGRRAPCVAWAACITWLSKLSPSNSARSLPRCKRNTFRIRCTGHQSLGQCMCATRMTSWLRSQRDTDQTPANPLIFLGL